MELTGIALAAVCMIAMCGVGMWLIVRMGSRRRRD
jgi:hypothetical protein